MEHLVTYDLVLALIDPAKERFVVDATSLDHVLAAAAVVDAVDAGVVSIDLGVKESRRRLVRSGSKRPANALLALVQDHSESVKPKRLVFDLGAGAGTRRKGRTVRDLAIHHLESAGAVAPRRSSALGRHRAPRLRVLDRPRRDAIVSGIHEVLVGGDPPDPHAAALAVLLRSVDADRRLFKDLDRKTLRKRVARIAEGDWMSEELSDAVESAVAAAAEAAAAEPVGAGLPPGS